AELLEAVALGNPLRAERHAHVQPAAAQVLLDVGRDPRVDRAAQDHDLAVAQVRQALVEGPVDGGERRGEVLVDGGADDEGEEAALAKQVGPAGHFEFSGGQGAPERVPSAFFLKGHLAGPDAGDGRLVDVVDDGPQAGAGEGQGQRQADVTA